MATPTKGQEQKKRASSHDKEDEGLKLEEVTPLEQPEEATDVLDEIEAELGITHQQPEESCGCGWG